MKYVLFILTKYRLEILMAALYTAIGFSIFYCFS